MNTHRGRERSAIWPGDDRVSAGEYWRRKYDNLARMDIPNWQKSYWWDEGTYLRQRHYVLKTIERLSRVRKLRILDIGCGPGDLARYLTSRGHRVVGVDYSYQALLCAKREWQWESGFLCMADGKDLPFKDKYDIILILGVLGTETEWKRLLNEALRTLEPGGTAILSFHRQHSIFEILLWPIYMFYYCGYLPEKNRLFPAVEFIRHRHTLYCAREQEGSQAISRYKYSEVRKAVETNDCRIIDKKLSSWFGRVPCLFNSFLVFATIRKNAKS